MDFSLLFHQTFVICCQEFLIYECCFQMAPLIFVYMSTMTKHNFYVLWCSFPFYATYFIRCHRMSSYVGTVLCVFCCLKVFFFFIVQAFRWSQEIKTKEWNKWNITTEKIQTKNWWFQKCINSFIVLTFWNRNKKVNELYLPTWGAKWGFVNF